MIALCVGFRAKLRGKSLRQMWAVPAVMLSMSIGTAGQADPLGLVDYQALMAANPDRSFCTGGTLCTVVLPDGAVVQEGADGDWLAGGNGLTAGSFSLGYALILAIEDACGRLLDGIDAATLDTAIAEMKGAYHAGLAQEGIGQAVPSADEIDRAFDALRQSLASYIDADPDLSRCIVPGALASLLVEMAQEEYWLPELTRLQESPTLPAANFTIE